MRKRLLFILIVVLSFIFISSCINEDAEYINDLTCKVTFVGNNDKPDEVVSVEKGKKVSPIEVTKVDHKFLGWFIDEECSVLFDFNVKVNASFSLYASWEYVEPIVIKPKDVSVDSSSELLEIDEVKNLLENKKEYDKTFDYYILTGVISEIIDETNGIFRIKLDDLTILVQGIDSEFNTLNLQVGDIIKLRAVFTYLNGLTMVDAMVKEVKYIDRFVSVNVSGIVTKHNIKDCPNISYIETPSKEDYTFDGWFYDEKYENEVNINDAFTTDIVIYAKFTPIPYYYVTVHTGDNPITYKWLEKVSIKILNIPEKEDYIFDGWCFDAELSDTIPDDFNFSYTCDVYPRFKPIPYFYVTIHVGDNPEPIRYLDPLDVNKIAKPSKDKHVFVGWYFDAEYNKAVPSVYSINMTCDLYPKFEKIPYYYVTTHIDGATETFEWLGDVSINTLVEPVKTDYLFVDWYFDDGFTKKVPDDYVFKMSCDIYAKFTAIPYCHITVYFDNNTYQNRWIDKVSLSEVISTYNLVKDGYEFRGWYFDADYTDEIPSDYVFTEDDIIYGDLHKIMYYTLTLHVDGKTSSVVVKELTTLSENKINDPVKEDHLFNGWYLDSGYTKTFNKETKITKNLDLYARFTYVETYYNVKMVIDGSEKTEKYAKNTKISQINVKSIDDFYFDGWYLDDAYQNKYDGSTKITSDVTIYGRYLPIPYHTVTIHVLDKVTVKTKITEDTSLKQILSNPSIEDYIFDGWYLDSDHKLIANLNSLITTDLVVYAKMTKINYYDVEIHVLDKTAVKNKIRENTNLSSLLSNPSIEGYYFRGWFLDSGYTIKVTNATLVNGDTKVYAKMDKINYYTLKTIVLDAEIPYSNIEEGTVISSILTNPSVVDYIFDGWFIDSSYKTPFKITSTLTSDLVLYAKMTKINYYHIKVIYLNELGESVNTINLPKVKEATILSSIIKNPNYEDYYFMGYYATSSFDDNKLDLSKVSVNEDLIIYGKLQTIPYYDVSIIVDGVCKTVINVKDQTSISTIDLPTKPSDRYGTYTFDAWYLDQDFNTSASTTQKITSNMSLYAKFSVKRNYYIKQIVNGVETTITLVDPNNTVSRLKKPSTYSDDDNQYVFKCWSMDSVGNNILKDSDKFTETDNTVYAIFTKTPYYTVSINTLGNITTQKVLKGTLISTLKSPTLDGYVFNGWYSDENFKTKVNLDKKIESDLVIYAKMNKYITITSVVNNESTTTKLLTEDSISKIIKPDLYDYRFIAWYFDDGYSQIVPNDYIFMDSITIYAKLEVVPYYTVKIYNDTTTSFGLSKYDEMSVREATVLSDWIKKLTTPKVVGYKFDSWYLDVNFEISVDGQVINSDFELYAKYIPLDNTKYTVKYWLEGDSSYSNLKVQTFTGTTGTKVTPSVKEVYDEIVNKEYYSVNYIPTGIISGDGSLVLEVYFKRNLYTVKYHVEGAICYESEPIRWGDPVTFLSNKSFEELVGEAFISGWYKNPDFTGLIDYETMLPGGIDIYGDVELIYPGSSGILYELNDEQDGYVVIGYNGTDEDVIISNGYNGLPVTSIGSAAFYDCTQIKTITMSKHILEINAKAFAMCTNLERIILSDNITFIGNMAFSGCEKLTSVTLPKSLNLLGYDVFKDCAAISEISILDSNESYVTADNVLFNKNKTNLIYYASCKPNTKYEIPSSVTEISSNAITFVNSLKELIIGEEVEFVNSFAINNCNNLEMVEISSSVTTLGLAFIDHCLNLKQINVSDKNMFYSSCDGVLYNKDKTILYLYPSNNQSTNFIIPETVRSIEYKAFQYNKWLNKLILTKNIKKVANISFYECSNLIIEVNYVSAPVRWNVEWYYNVKEVVFNKE